MLQGLKHTISVINQNSYKSKHITQGTNHRFSSKDATACELLQFPEERI
jgi:hypothetical protein